MYMYIALEAVATLCAGKDSVNLRTKLDALYYVHSKKRVTLGYGPDDQVFKSQQGKKDNSPLHNVSSDWL